jgi:hypothetical protein
MHADIIMLIRLSSLISRCARFRITWLGKIEVLAAYISIAYSLTQHNSLFLFATITSAHFTKLSLPTCIDPESAAAEW